MVHLKLEESIAEAKAAEKKRCRAVGLCDEMDRCEEQLRQLTKPNNQVTEVVLFLEGPIKVPGKCRKDVADVIIRGIKEQRQEAAAQLEAL